MLLVRRFASCAVTTKAVRAISSSGGSLRCGSGSSSSNRSLLCPLTRRFSTTPTSTAQAKPKPPAQKFDCVVVGAGVAGLSTAYHLVTRYNKRVCVVDRDLPLSNTSVMSSECYRNYWGADQHVTSLTNRSIDIMKQIADSTHNSISLGQAGYLFVASQPDSVSALVEQAKAWSGLAAASATGNNKAGKEPLLRMHKAGDAPYDPTKPVADGVDVLLGPSLVQRSFPYLDPTTHAVVHARRCGWLSAQQLGQHYLNQARSFAGGDRFTFIRGEVTGVNADSQNKRVTGVSVVPRSEEGESTASSGGSGSADPVTLTADAVCNAAGPWQFSLNEMMRAKPLAVRNELHAKIVFRDTLGVVPRTAPMIIANDPTPLFWSIDEQNTINTSANAPVSGAEAEETADTTAQLLADFPAGLHFRPYGGVDSSLYHHTTQHTFTFVPCHSQSASRCLLRRLCADAVGVCPQRIGSTASAATTRLLTTRLELERTVRRVGTTRCGITHTAISRVFCK